MIIPDIYDVIDLQLIKKWRDGIERDEKCSVMEKPAGYKKILAEQLDDEQKILLDNFELSVIDKMDYISYSLCRHLFYFAVKAGADMQKAFDNDE